MIPGNRKLDLHPKFVIRKAATRGAKLPDTFWLVDSTLHHVPNWAGTNHWKIVYIHDSCLRNQHHFFIVSITVLHRNMSHENTPLYVIPLIWLLTEKNLYFKKPNFDKYKKKNTFYYAWQLKKWFFKIPRVINYHATIQFCRLQKYVKYPQVFKTKFKPHYNTRSVATKVFAVRK